MKATIAIACLIVSAIAQAKPIEVWECQQTPYGDWDKILVVASVEEGRKVGTIAVAGVTHEAKFHVTGFDRRWDFGLENSSYRYAFVVRPNGQAAYYDFAEGKSATPSNTMMCRQRTISQ